VFVDDERARAWRKELQRLEELDDRILVGGSQVLKRRPLMQRFTAVREIDSRSVVNSP
jgi:hypothetical protein